VIVDDYLVARNGFRDQGEINFAHLPLSSTKRRTAADLNFTPLAYMTDCSYPLRTGARAVPTHRAR
jgi:hypothetical protein